MGERMKFIIMTFIFCLGAIAQAATISVTVNGMVCAMCAQGIQKKFKKLQEVQNIKVDLDTKIVTIQTKKESTIDDQVITKIITEAGYIVKGIERK